MRDLIDPLDTLELSDFENHRLRQSYLGAYGVYLDLIDCRRWGLSDYYSMSWGHGFMQATPGDKGLDTAEVWAFTFIWHWLRGVKVCYFDDSGRKGAQDLAYEAANAYYKHKTRFGQIHPKKEKGNN